MIAEMKTDILATSEAAEEVNLHVDKFFAKLVSGPLLQTSITCIDQLREKVSQSS